MTVQVRNDVQLRQFHLRGDLKSKDSVTIAQDATRSGDIAPFTVLAQDPATALWEVLVDVTAADGTGVPRGITVSTITEADIKAGNVTNQMIIVGGGSATVDKDLLVFDGGTVELDDEITALNITVEAALRQMGIFTQSTDYVSQLENS